MSDFSQDIQNFRRYGTYTYTFDNVGNSIFDSSSVNFNQVYIAFPLQNVVYDNSKIETMYVVDFQEFIPQTSSISSAISVDELQQQLDVIQQENSTLKTQLGNIVLQNESSGSAADVLATKQVILQLRKAVGQGRVDSDFSSDFPYMPIIKPTT
jgi:hypothetical protein